MPALLDGVDLLAIAGVWLLIGLLMVVSYTFGRLAFILDVGILGVHPFRGISRAIESTIVAGCNDGIAVLQDVARDLWHGLTWSVGFLVDGIKDLANGTEDALTYLTEHLLIQKVNAAIKWIADSVPDLETRVETLAIDAIKDGIVIEGKIQSTAVATLETAERKAAGIVTGLRHEIAADFHNLRHDLALDIKAAKVDAEAVGRDAISALASAEETAIAGVRDAESATAQGLRDLLDSIPLTDIATVIAAVPIVKALLTTVLSESGLDGESCRSKVKGICGTDSELWGELVGGLVAVDFALNIREIVEAGNFIVGAISHELVELAS